jgi:hypothetical protein
MSRWLCCGGDPETDRLALPMATQGRAGAFGGLFCAAFIHAVRKRFSPAWTCSDIVGFVAFTRLDFLKCGINFSPKAAETLILEALGVPITSEFDPAIFLIVLVQIILDEQLDDNGLTAFLADARMDADARLARAAGP